MFGQYFFSILFVPTAEGLVYKCNKQLHGHVQYMGFCLEIEVIMQCPLGALFSVSCSNYVKQYVLLQDCQLFSQSCASGCHEAAVGEWQPSAASPDTTRESHTSAWHVMPCLVKCHLFRFYFIFLDGHVVFQLICSIFQLLTGWLKCKDR